MGSIGAPLCVVVEEEEEEWELASEDGFVYKRKRRRLDPPEAVAATSPVDPAAEEKRRRERRRKTLLKVRAKYRAEIQQWEVLSNNLRAMEETTRMLQRRFRREGEEGTASLMEASPIVKLSCAPMVDDLLSQVEGQDAIIGNVSKLCDIAEALCKTEEDRLTQCLIDLPIWASPRELMASLCEDE